MNLLYFDLGILHSSKILNMSSSGSTTLPVDGYGVGVSGSFTFRFLFCNGSYSTLTDESYIALFRIRHDGRFVPSSR